MGFLCYESVSKFGKYMGGCEKCGPFLGTLNIRGRIIIGIQKGTIVSTTPHTKVVYFEPVRIEAAHQAAALATYILNHDSEAVGKS